MFIDILCNYTRQHPEISRDITKLDWAIAVISKQTQFDENAAQKLCLSSMNTIRRQLPTNCLSVFYRLVGLARKG